MAVQYFGPDEHPLGFIGYLVTVKVAGTTQERFLHDHFNCTTGRDYLSTKARYVELGLELEDLEHRYRRFVSSAHARTKPGRGIGLHSLTIAFIQAPNGTWIPVFKVARERSEEKKGPHTFSLKQQLFSEAWAKAVHCWADEHGILPEDRQATLGKPPSPDAFKELRRIMVEEGHDLPPSVLRPVYREQREQIQERRVEKTPLNETMTEWFQKSLAEHASGQ